MSLVDWRRCVADSPLLRRGQSASQSRNSSRDVVGYGELAEVYCGQSATGSRTVRRTILPTHQNRVPLWTKLQSIRRTVCSPIADRPQYTHANPPETTTSLEQSLNSTADCPAPLGGPSAVQVSIPPETTTSLDKILHSTTDCPRPSGGPSAVKSCEPHQRHRL